MKAGGCSKAVFEDERLAADSRSFYEALSELLAFHSQTDHLGYNLVYVLDVN